MNQNNSNETNPSPEIRESNETFREMIRFFRDFIIILLVVIMIRAFVMTPFRINGQSMEPSYFDKEYILVNKWSYLDFATHFEEMRDSTQPGGIMNTLVDFLEKLPIHNGDPQRGDVVVVKPHVDMEREFYIKRVIGIPGDTIRIRDGKVWLKIPENADFVELKESYLGANEGKTYLPQNIEDQEFVVPEGGYWVMGDNRVNSADSRSCFVSNCAGKTSSHFIKRGDIVGSVLVDFGYFNIFKNGKINQGFGSLSWIHKPRFFNTPKSHTYTELEIAPKKTEEDAVSTTP